MSAPRMPSLGRAGAKLWRQLTSTLELEPHEVPVLELAARTADTIAALERQVERDGRMVEGSRGQPKVHPGLAELRQQRLALGRLLAQLRPADDEEEGAGQRAGRRAAEARWSRRRGVQRRRRALTDEVEA